MGKLRMKFNIYGRFQVDVQREHDAWVVYRSVSGKRTRMNEVLLLPELAADELATYLDDLFHEFARKGENVVPIPG
jgi:hypothetical protein